MNEFVCILPLIIYLDEFVRIQQIIIYLLLSQVGLAMSQGFRVWARMQYHILQEGLINVLFVPLQYIEFHNIAAVLYPGLHVDPKTLGVGSLPLNTHVGV